MNIDLNFIFPVLPAIIQMILLLFIFKLETPKYYLIKEDCKKAKLSYNKIHPPTRMTKLSTSISDTLDFEEHDVLDSIDTNKDGRTYRSLLKPRYRRPFLIGIMLIVIQQMSGINFERSDEHTANDDVNSFEIEKPRRDVIHSKRQA